MRSFRLGVLLGALGAVTGCGGAAPARYSGANRARVVTAAEVREVAALPRAYEPLGQLSTECRRDLRPRALDDELLSDVDCSEERLSQVLREQTADVAGELLVARECSARASSLAPEIQWLTCTGTVARAEEALRERRRRGETGTPMGRLEPYPAGQARAAEGWAIRVDSRLSQVAPRAPLRSDQVREYALAPLGSVELADVLARCVRGCTERGARSGVLAAAARHGGSGVVGVRCIRHGQEGWLCTGTATGEEVVGRD